jgi:transcriptional regulator with XRE-family HTH domain
MSKKKAPTTVKAISTTDETPSRRLPASNNVRRFRQERKWTQWQLAQISRLSVRTIQRVESGYRMGVTAELALASAFEIDIPVLHIDDPPNMGNETQPDNAGTFRLLKRVVSGATLLDIIKEEQVGFDAGDVSAEERPIVEDFLQHVTAMGMMRKKARLDKYRKLCQVFQTKLDELDARGVWVFGDRSNQMNPGGDARKEGLLVFKRSDDPEIICPQLLRQFGKAMCFISVAVAH